MPRLTDEQIEAARQVDLLSFLSAQKPNSLLLSVFESPIDALSHMTLGELFGWEQGGYRLSLGGTSHIALTAFLECHRQINRVIALG